MLTAASTVAANVPPSRPCTTAPARSPVDEHPHHDDMNSPSTMADLPIIHSPNPQGIPVSRAISELDLNALSTRNPHSAPTSSAGAIPVRHISMAPLTTHTGASSPSTLGDTPAALPSIISPAYTPPSTPGVVDPFVPARRASSQHQHGLQATASSSKPRLLPVLPTVRCIVRARIPTTTGTEMFLHLYQNSEDSKEHLAIVFGSTIRSRSLDQPREGETEMDRLIRGAYVGRLWPGRTDSGMTGKEMGEPRSKKNGENHDARMGEVQPDPPLVRIHSECYTGETVWSTRCDCGEQLDEAARLMSAPPPAGSPLPAAGGVIIYLRQEGRGIGLGEKLKAYNLQDLGSDTVEANLLLRHPADARSYGLATAMLVDLGVTEIRLLTNNPDKVRAVEGPGRVVRVVDRVPMVPIAWKPSTTGEDDVEHGSRRKGIHSAEIGGYLRTKVCRY